MMGLAPSPDRRLAGGDIGRRLLHGFEFEPSRKADEAQAHFGPGLAILRELTIMVVVDSPESSQINGSPR